MGQYIYGCSGIAIEIAELMKKNSMEIDGFTVDDEFMGESNFVDYLNLPIVPIKSLVNSGADNNIIISNGEPKYREMLSERLTEYGLGENGIIMAAFVSANAVIGEGTIAHYGSFISNNTKIGKSCLINKNVIVGHDSSIGDYSVVSPSATIGGKTQIGKGCFIGLGACIRDRITIGNNCIVGFGAVVAKDIPDNVVVAGNPAKIIRENDKGTVFKH